MASEPPVDIPPRTSSTGMANGPILSERRTSGLGPVSESEWMGSSKRGGASGTTRHSRNTPSVDWTRYKDGFWTSDKEKILLGPYEYMLQHPGKDIRKQMIAGFNVWLDVPQESLAIITKVVTMLHSASLLVDDVEDSSTLRRGAPVAHNIFGTAQTINSANYVYFLALQEVQKLNNPAAINIYVQELLNLHRGQGMDLFWRDTLTCPTEDEYLEMVGNKTGGLFRLAVKLMQAESKTGKECVALASVMGVIFQICDDYLNLADTTYSKNKGMCEDLTEGKFSFPIIHSIRADSSNIQLISILKLKTNEDEVKHYALKYMESTGSFAYTRAFVARLREQALKLIDEIEGVAEGKSRQGESTGQMVRDILEKIVDSTMRHGIK